MKPPVPSAIVGHTMPNAKSAMITTMGTPSSHRIPAFNMVRLHLSNEVQTDNRGNR